MYTIAMYNYTSKANSRNSGETMNTVIWKYISIRKPDKRIYILHHSLKHLVLGDYQTREVISSDVSKWLKNVSCSYGNKLCVLNTNLL